jgi:hypothetical protein
MQHLEGSGTPVLYIGRMALKGQGNQTPMEFFLSQTHHNGGSQLFGTLFCVTSLTFQT